MYSHIMFTCNTRFDSVFTHYVHTADDLVGYEHLVCCSHSAHSRRFIKKFAGKRRPLAWLPVHSTDVFFTMNYKHPKTFSGIPCCCLARSLIPPSHFPLFVIFTYFSSVKLFFPSLSCRLMTCAQKPRNTCTHWVSEK